MDYLKDGYEQKLHATKTGCIYIKVLAENFSDYWKISDQYAILFYVRTYDRSSESQMRNRPDS